MWEAKVRAYLKANKVSQESFAEAMGVTQGWLSHKLTGKRKATVQDLSKMAAEMGLPLKDLILGSEDVDKPQQSDDDLSFIQKYQELDDGGRKAISVMIDELIAREARK
jgi:transcriptional regulator with XRE-family HTH domain